MFKLAINAGHGYETAGKRCLKSIDANETREYVLNKRIADKVETALREYEGIEILRIDNGTDLSISKRAAAANSFGADFYLAIHHNAGINGGAGGGTECYVYLKVDELTKAWQREIYENVITSANLRGNRAQPLRQADFGECRETRMPAVLIECGFMDSTVDTPIILSEDFAQKCANGIVNAIVLRANLNKRGNENPQSVQAETAPNPAPEKKSTNEIAREVIAGRWGNGQERKQRLSDAGYDYSLIQSTVNNMLGADGKRKTVDELAYEVIKGLWGNGQARKDNLKKEGYDYSVVQKRVNEILL